MADPRRVSAGLWPLLFDESVGTSTKGFHAGHTPSTVNASDEAWTAVFMTDTGGNTVDTESNKVGVKSPVPRFKYVNRLSDIQGKPSGFCIASSSSSSSTGTSQEISAIQAPAWDKGVVCAGMAVVRSPPPTAPATDTKLSADEALRRNPARLLALALDCRASRSPNEKAACPRIQSTRVWAPHTHSVSGFHPSCPKIRAVPSTAVVNNKSLAILELVAGLMFLSH
eukprot:scaffold4772_cov153-Amphora_coffeaeformis.AAC.2